MATGFAEFFLPELFQSGAKGLEGLAQGKMAGLDLLLKQLQLQKGQRELQMPPIQAFGPGTSVYEQAPTGLRHQFTTPDPRHEAELSEKKREFGLRLGLQRESLEERRAYHQASIKERAAARQAQKGKPEELAWLEEQRKVLATELASLQKGPSLMEQWLVGQQPGGQQLLAEGKQVNKTQIDALYKELHEIDARIGQIRTGKFSGPFGSPAGPTPLGPVVPPPIKVPNVPLMKQTPVYKQTYERWSEAFMQDRYPTMQRAGKALADPKTPPTEKAAINDALTGAGF